MSPSHTAPRSEGEFLLYSAPNGEVKISVHFEDETAWLSQKAMTEDSVIRRQL